ncbi:MAG: hypothetical protein CME62_12310 [Halobacteriovoraceae bacterium]|nr:hypothetical protein [Halobacteriovoraceae bacterium]|tara:strand:+ start:1323 stop:1934 length:612 start_codon:yes stop_codon:yes gene_type:complete
MDILNQNLDNYHALLFDFDGTLVDSMPIHNQAWIQIMADMGVHITERFLFETMGLSSQRIVGIINEQKNLNLDPEEIARAKRDHYFKRLDQVKIVPQVFDIIKYYYQKKPLGIITGGSHEVVDKLLALLNIELYFNAVVCADDTITGKDTSAPYMLACEQLSVSPQNSLFFDDGDVGLKGAKLTGMDVIHVDVNHPDVFIDFI